MAMNLRMHGSGNNCLTSFDLFDIWKYLIVNLSMIALLFVSCCRKRTEQVPLPLPQIYSVREAESLQLMDNDMTHVPDSRSQKSVQDGGTHPKIKIAAGEQQDSSHRSELPLQMRNLRGIVAERRKQLELKKKRKELTKRERKGCSRPSATVLEPSQVTKMAVGEKKNGSMTAKKNETIQKKGEHTKAIVDVTVDGSDTKRNENAVAAKPPKKERTDGGLSVEKNDQRKTKNAGNATTISTKVQEKKSGDGGRRTKTTTTSTKTRKSKDAANKSADDSPRKRGLKKTEKKPQKNGSCNRKEEN